MARFVTHLAERAPRLHKALSIGIPVVLAIVVASTVVSVNTFPIISNDSVRYIEHSRDIAGGGLVENGYRQVGYPAFLAVTRFFANSVGAEPFLSAALLQRFLLLAAAVVAWRMWRWWALPLVAFLMSAQTVVYTNFLLTEGLALSLVVLLVFPTTLLLKELAVNDVGGRRRVITLVLLVTAGVVGLYALRFTYVIFLVIPLILAVKGWRTPYRRLTLAALGATVVLIGGVALLTSLENQNEYGVFWPSVKDDPVRYYFAWQQVFTLRPENRENPELAGFFDDGVVHDFGREVSIRLPPEVQHEIWDAEIAAMLQAAGLSHSSLRTQSFLASLVGGRLDDIGKMADRAIRSNRLDVDELIYVSWYYMENGHQGFVDALNDGKLVEVVITDPLGTPSLIPTTRSLVAVLVPLSLLTMTIGIGFRATRWLAIIGLTVVVSFALGMGWLLADNFRFLVPTSGFGVAVACGVLSTVWMEHGSSRRSDGQLAVAVDDDQGEDRILLPEEPDVVNTSPHGI